MELNLYSIEKDEEEIPDSTPINKLSVKSNQAVMLIDAWMPRVRLSIESRSINKTLTIPKWLNDIVKDSNINCSQVLQDGLIRALGIEKIEHGRHK